MTANLSIYNTLGRELQLFQPLNPGIITMYQCGPTVYWNQHIGNMRAMVMSDLVLRSLKLLYPNHEIRFVRNYTDVGHLTGDNMGDADTGEDRMDKAVRREGITADQIADKYIAQFESDVLALNCMPVQEQFRARATHHIEEMISLVSTLIDRGFAYVTPLAVYFDISKKQDYTKLSGQDMSKLLEGHGHGDESDNNKRNPGDFALWFFRAGAHAQALQYWSSPFDSPLVQDGHGFPGWHIECSAMAMQYLGETIDIHFGGIEHVPIHHTNEIAQSESATGKEFARYWMHNEHLNVDGGKMSKSDGTSYLLSDIIDKGFEPMDLRYFFLQAHYRSKQNFTWEALKSARAARQRIQGKVTELIQRHHDVSSNLDSDSMGEAREIIQLKSCLEKDFNVPLALALLHDILGASGNMK